jgi:hypothetical protein
MTTKGLLPILLIAVGCLSCGSQKKERPSPLRADSVVFNTHLLRVDFSSPAVKSREIWGELVPYDHLWRTGANDASTFFTSGPIKIQGYQIDSGKYAIFTIPGKNQWQLILNENWNQWGTYNYDSTLDVARIKVTPRMNAEFSERLKFYFENDSLKFNWEKLGFSLSLE